MRKGQREPQPAGSDSETLAWDANKGSDWASKGWRGGPLLRSAALGPAAVTERDDRVKWRPLLPCVASSNSRGVCTRPTRPLIPCHGSAVWNMLWPCPMQIRYSPDPQSYQKLSTAELRAAFLVESLF